LAIPTVSFLFKL